MEQEETNLCKSIRKAHGMTQEQFAEALGRSRRTIINWESATEIKPRVERILLDFHTEGAI